MQYWKLVTPQKLKIIVENHFNKSETTFIL